MKNFIDYLLESVKEFNYVIKFAEQPTPEQTEIIETWLKRFNLIEMSKPVLQEDNTLDFTDVNNRQVYACNIKLGVPVSSYVLLQDLRTAANMNEKMIHVRGEHEPVENYANYEMWSKIQDDLATKDGMVNAPRLSTDREYLDIEQPPVTDVFGDEYNKKFLSYLAGVQNERPTMNIDPPAPIFSWIKMPKLDVDAVDFNKDFDGPKPATKGTATQPIDPKFLERHGGMSNAATTQPIKLKVDPKTGKQKNTRYGKDS
jgi:hypothetical protein